MRHTARKILLILGLLLPSVAAAQGGRHGGQLIGSRGLPLANQNVTVCTEPATTTSAQCTPVATTYPDITLTNYAIAASGAVRSGNFVTITTTASHRITPGTTVTIAGVGDASFNGTFMVASASGNSFGYSQVGSNSTSGGGTVSGANPFSTDALGNFFFYAAAGSYAVEFSGPQIQPTYYERNVVLATGTVSSVALSAPSQFAVSGSPVTGSGTLGLAWTNQNANTHLAGPSSGGAAAPAFRAEVAADLPATTANCSGVQFAQGLNAGGTPVCATPPTFGASGGSHAVGYVPDPGSSAGTTRFLREDATFAVPPAGGVSEAVVSGTVTSGVCASGSPSNCAVLFIPANAHTLTRLVSVVTTAGAGCSANSQWAIIDLSNSNAVLASGTPSNTVGTVTDSGALSVSMTAGHRFALGQANNPTGCTTFEAAIISANFQ